MNKSEFLELNLPSRDNSTDSADINKISENFATIDKAFLDLVEKELPKFQTKENMTTALSDETSDENLYPNAKAVVNYVKPIKNNMVGEFSDNSTDETKYPNVLAVVNYTNDKIDPFKIVNTAKGNSIVLKDSSNLPFENLKLFGKTEQDERFFKNALPTPTFESQWYRSIFITNLKDGRIQLNGTSETVYEAFTIADNVVLNSLKVGGRYRWHCKNAEANNVDVAVTLSWVKDGVSMTKELVSNEDEFIAEASSINATVQMLMERNIDYDCIITPEIYLAEAPLVSVGDSGSFEVGVYSRNLFNNTQSGYTLNGLTVTINDDKSVTVNGTATATTTLNLGEIGNLIKGQTYKPVNSLRCRLQLANGTIKHININQTFTYTDEISRIYAYLSVSNGATVNTTYYPMIVLTTETNLTYEQYKGKQSITLTDTLRGIGDYKDEVDFVNGIINQRLGYIASYNGETITTDYISSTGELSIGAEVVYVLPTPIETPISESELNAYRQLHTNKPNTTILSEAEMEVDYVADPKLYIDNKIAELTALTLEG